MINPFLQYARVIAGTFVANFNQGASTNTNLVSVSYVLIGDKWVILELPQVGNITMNIGGAAIYTGNVLPLALTPQRNVEVCFRARNGGAADAVGDYGTVDIQTGGVIEIIRKSAWSVAAANCGWTPFNLSYSIA